MLRPDRHKLQCRCGAIQGFISPTRPSVRCVCCCDECQSFARFLKATALLGPTGGTELIQLAPLQVVITSGKDRLSCIRLSERGLLRWYSRCCLTPIATTAADWRVSVVSLARTSLGNDAGALQASFGPVRLHFSPEPALGAHEPPVDDRYCGALSATWLRFGARAAGEYRHTPFFDRITGRPIADPRTLETFDGDARLASPLASRCQQQQP